MRPADLYKRLDDQPFKPFRIHLSDGTKLDVLNPGMVIVSRSSAIIPTEFEHDEEGYRLVKNWRTIALRHIVQFSDLSDSSNARRRRRK
jgi:hypothetical protein